MNRSKILTFLFIQVGCKLNPYNPLTYLWIVFAIIEGFVKHSAIFIKELPKQIKNSF